MRCKQMREIVGVHEELPAEIREHLQRCPACSEYVRDFEVLRAGFRALAEDDIPEPSVGFAARLARRLEEMADAAGFSTEFFEQVGRRFVYAVSLLTLALLLSLVLPSAGPLRGPTSAEIYLAQPESSAFGNDPVFTQDSADVPDVVPGAHVGRENR